MSLFRAPRVRSTTGFNALFRCSACLLVLASAGCASRPGWGLRGMGQGTTERQKSRAAVHDPYPLNDIGPEVVGGRPREFYNPQAEPVRNQVTASQFPGSFAFPPR